VSNRPEDRAYFERLQETVAANALGEVVAFGGFRGGMNRLYPTLDLLAHASIEPEPLGMVLAEAMACGVPVVASHGGGPEDIVIEGETGWLVGRGDVTELADRMVSVVADPTLLARIGQRARVRAVREFSAAAASERLLAVYSELIRG
jgi:glycosyltransferase involved in cell wall biosynthesis